MAVGVFWGLKTTEVSLIFKRLQIDFKSYEANKSVSAHLKALGLEILQDTFIVYQNSI